MISIRRSYFWRWRPELRRIGMGFRIYLPAIQIKVGHDGPPCRVCGERGQVACWLPENPGAAVCIECCPHDEYEYDPGERNWMCVECGSKPPYDWSGYDHVEP